MALTAVQEAIHLLFGRTDLTTAQADAAMSEIMQGEATPAQIGAFLAALRMKGETVAEITGCATAMKRNAVQVRPKIGDARLIDVVGTGGDSANTFNISTTAAFVVAGHGVRVAKHGNASTVKVAKHGNRSVSSKSGAADVLGALGVNINLTAEQAAECIEEVGIAFLFAPVYHPAMRHAIGPRREMAARTIFNILGPLTNPANATHLLVGVYDAALVETLAQVLGQMGAKAAMVVHGHSGLDELSLTGPNVVCRYTNGQVERLTIDPAEYGMGRATLDDLRGGEAAENAEITRGILTGKVRGAKRDAVLLNAGAALSAECGDLAAGIAEAQESLDSGAALETLERFAEKSQSFASKQG